MSKLNIPTGIYYDPKCNNHKNIGIFNKNTNFIEVVAHTEEQRREIKPLLIDSLNTYQKCEKLPSQLLEQNEKLLKFVKASIDEILHLKDEYKDSGHCMRYLNEAGEFLKYLEQ